MTDNEILWNVIAPSGALVTFLLAALLTRSRTIVFLGGAVLISVLGFYLGTFSASEVLTSIHNAIPTLLLIAELELFSIIMVEKGLSDWLLNKIMSVTDYISMKILKGKVASQHLISLALVGLTYFISCWMNNLAAIFIMLPLLFQIGPQIGLSVKPLVVVLIIASNLGGASTPIGDFPNILISEYAEASFTDFIANLGIWMLAQLILVTIFYFASKRRRQTFGLTAATELSVYRVHLRRTGRIPLSPSHIVFVAIFIGMILTWTTLPEFNPDHAALIGGGFLVLLLVSLRIQEDVLKKVDVSVLALFASLFVISAAINSTGLLQRLGDWLLSNQSTTGLVPAFGLLGISWILTSFVSAGPSTATLIPLAQMLEQFMPVKLAWWVLSFGVQAGSSMTLIGATSGPVAARLFEKYTGKRFSIWDFSRVSFPLVAIFLVISASYVLITTVV